MASSGYPGIITPQSTTEWEAVLADVRAHFNANCGLLQTSAAILRRELPKARNVHGRRGFAGADLRIAALQIARHWNQAAAGQTSAAVALTKADAIFNGTFAPAGAGRHSDGRFDAGK